jgi:predicted transposase/invertase (TIGR01784 family)
MAKEFNHDANKHSWTKEELDTYDYAAMREQDERGKIELAEKRSKLEVARNLKSMGLSSADISKATGLSEEEITSI